MVVPSTGASKTADNRDRGYINKGQKTKELTLQAKSRTFQAHYLSYREKINAHLKPKIPGVSFMRLFAP